jgi:hypothetical protein
MKDAFIYFLMLWMLLVKISNKKGQRPLAFLGSKQHWHNLVKNRLLLCINS